MLANQMLEQFSKSIVPHPGETGNQREHLVIELVRQFIPERFGIVQQGTVIDSSGAQSKNIDIVIYDRLVTPILEYAKTKLIPCEGVVAIGEVKTSIDSKPKLEDVLEHLESVHTLDRHMGYSNDEVAVLGLHGHTKMRRVGEDLPTMDHRIFSFIFTMNSLTSDSVTECLDDYCKEKPIRYWPNTYIAAKDFLVSYHLGPESAPLRPFPDGAVGFYVTDSKEKDRVVLLFSTLLLNALSIVKIVRPIILEYMGVKTSKVNVIPFGFWMNERMKNKDWWKKVSKIKWIMGNWPIYISDSQQVRILTEKVRELSEVIDDLKISR